MNIINANITVDDKDNFGSATLIGCRIYCNFNLFKDNYKNPNTFEIRGYFEDKSSIFTSVFKGVSMESCILNGTDTNTDYQINPKHSQ